MKSEDLGEMGTRGERCLEHGRIYLFWVFLACSEMRHSWLLLKSGKGQEEGSFGYFC